MCLIVLMIFCLFPSYCFAASGISMKAGAVSAQPGTEVNVPLNIVANSGVASLKLAIKYDNTYLTLTKVTFPNNTGTYSSVPVPYSKNQVINFVSPLSSFNKTGLFATLTFSVNENAVTDRMEAITIEFNEDDIFDMNFNNVPLTVSNGSIYITDEITEIKAILPSALVTIADESFMNTSFSYVELPETVTTIGSKAFANSSNLKYIYIPEKTTTIAQDAFLNVPNLTILGKSGSYAESFASRYGFAFQAR